MLDSRLLESLRAGAIEGIGSATIGKLIELFGIELSNILNQGKATSLVPHIGKKRAAALLAGWKRLSEREAIVDWCAQLGLSPSDARTIIDTWGGSAIEKIENNPYRLLAILEWKVVDSIAATLGVDAGSPARLVGAIEQVMYGALDSGSTVVSDHDLLKGFIALQPKNVPASVDPQALASSALELAVDSGALLRIHSGLQIPGAHFAERDIEEWVRVKMNGGVSTKIKDSCLQNLLARQSFVVTKEQEEAVRNSLFNRLSLLHGGAGVGKTVTVKLICDASEMLLQREPVLLAVAAKAARRMSEATGREASTIASFLLRRRQPSQMGRIYIIDEFSMVDLLIFRNLTRSIESHSHVVLVGDPAQLPPVGAGRLLHDFIGCNEIPTQELTVVQRQGSHTNIPKTLQAVRSGVWPDIELFDWLNPSDECVSLIIASDHTIAGICKKLVGMYSSAIQFITPRVKSKISVNSLNPVLHHAIINDEKWLPGTRVVFTANQKLASGDYVVNGLIGTIEKWLTKNPRADYVEWISVETDWGSIKVTLGEARKILDLAWVLSVHKSQGSDWDTVAVIIPRDDFLVDRSMIYTALSRCRRRCIVIITDIEWIKDTVADAPKYLLRKTGLF